MIYLDNNATTSLDPEVFEAMKPFLTQWVGNPSSTHYFGQKAKGALLEATRQCALFLGVHSDEILFTSGATEALNLLIRGLPNGSHVITSSLEHSAVLEPLKISNYSVTYLDPYVGRGAIEPAQVEQALKETTRLIVLSAVNNETGIKTDVNEIAALAARHHVSFVLDGVAWLGKEAVILPGGVSAACFSGHKIHGPMGIGLAVVRKSFKTAPLIVGGGQQRGLRAGTENLPAIIGFCKALERAQLEGEKWKNQIESLRNQFEGGLQAALPDIVIHGKDQLRICNTSQIAFPGVDGETLLFALDLAGLAASHGSACSAGALTISRVLLSMGIPLPLVRSSLRFSLSRFTHEEEINTAISLIVKTISRLRLS